MRVKKVAKISPLSWEENCGLTEEQKAHYGAMVLAGVDETTRQAWEAAAIVMLMADGVTVMVRPQ